jgi:hypothetical protein
VRERNEFNIHCKEKGFTLLSLMASTRKQATKFEQAPASIDTPLCWEELDSVRKSFRREMMPDELIQNCLFHFLAVQRERERRRKRGK